MAWLAIDGNGEEFIYREIPVRCDDYWFGFEGNFELPSGSIEKLIGRKLTFEDEPVEI